MLVSFLPLSTVEAVDEGPRSEDGIGIYVYKSIAKFEKHIKGFLEPNAGAHYYVQTKYSSDYWNAIGIMDLRRIRIKVDNDVGNRAAILSLNVLANKGGVDIGVQNKGDGWFAYFYAPFLDKSDESYPYNQDYSRNDAKYRSAKVVRFSIDAKIQGGNDTVTGYFRFYGKKSRRTKKRRLIGKEKLQFYVPEGELYSVDGNGHPILRFTRFMSLVPLLPDGDVADYTYMRNARLTGLQLYHRRHGYQVWNMDRIDFAWSVQTANIRGLQIAFRDKGIDRVSLYHSYDYHRQNMRAHERGHARRLDANESSLLL